mgnify:FL=1
MKPVLTKKITEYDLSDLHIIHTQTRLKAEDTYTKYVFRLLKISLFLSGILIAVMYIINHQYKEIITIGLIVIPFLIINIYNRFRGSYIYRKTHYISSMIELKRRIDRANEKRDLQAMCLLDSKKVHPLVYAEVMNAPGVAKSYQELKHTESYVEGFNEGMRICQEIWTKKR